MAGWKSKSFSFSRFTAIFGLVEGSGQIICGLGEILSKNLNMEMVEKLSNCIRLLCDVHHMEPETRRAVILPGLDKAMKNSLENTEIGPNLFGWNLLEVEMYE